jgi:TRAP-type C4-dicarboxylate transport system permease small subunit
LLGDVPAWWLQTVMPVAFALMALQFFSQGVQRLRGTAPLVGERPL